jgi:hypothetical protein
MATREEKGKQGAEGAAETMGSPTRYIFPTLFFSRGHATQRLVERQRACLPCPLFIAAMQWKWRIILRNSVDILPLIFFLSRTRGGFLRRSLEKEREEVSICIVHRCQQSNSHFTFHLTFVKAFWIFFLENSILILVLYAPA